MQRDDISNLRIQKEKEAEYLLNHFGILIQIKKGFITPFAWLLETLVRWHNAVLG